MKIRNSSRITAIVLALMMIVPLISVPAFAEEAPTPVFTQDFNVEQLSDAIRQQGTNNQSASIKDIGGEHGKVFYYDLSEGPADYCDNDGEGYLYLVTDKGGYSKRIKLAKDALTFNADGTVTGYATIEGTEYKFENATLNKDNFKTKTTLYSIILTESYLFTTEGDFVYEKDLATAEYFLDEDDKQVKAADLVSGAVKYKMDDEGCLIALYEMKADAYATQYYLATAECVNAICGATNIGVPHWVNSDADIAGTEFTFSADYYISEDFTGVMDIRLLDTENFELAQITEVSGNSSNVLVRIHGSDAAGKIENTGIQVAKGTWFNLTVYAKSGGAEGAIEVYVNGNLAARGYDSSFSLLKLATANGFKGWSLGQANRGYDATYTYAGYYMIDNLAIYEGKVIPAATEVPAYTYSMNFTKHEAWTGYDTAGIAWDQEHNLYNGSAFKINSDTFNEATGEDYDYATHVMDKNLYQSKDAKELTGDKTYYFEADYFLVPGSRVKFEAQLKSGKADGSTKPVTAEDYNAETDATVSKGGFAWVTLFYVISDVEGATLNFSNMDPNMVVYQKVLPTGRWFTLSTKLNLQTGEAVLYLDGQVAATYTLYRPQTTDKKDLKYCSNITVGANNGLIAAKLSTMGNHKVDGVTVYYGHKSGEYANGYTDYVLVDNYQVYEDESLFKAAEQGFFYDDMEDRIWNVGTKAIAAYLKDSKELTPATATYAYAPDGDLALKLDMTPADSDKTTKDKYFGYGLRAYLAPVEVESFDPNDGMAVNFAKLTKTGSGAKGESSTDRILYYARVGTTVYVYTTDSNTKAEDAVANEDGSNLIYRGAYAIAPETSEGSGEYSMKYWECFTGGGNIDKKFTTYTPAYTYNAAEGANNTYVFSANYYVDADACGNVEAQLFQNYHNLYTLDLVNKVFLTSLNGTVVGDLLVDAWNKVEMIVTLTENNVKVDVYLNGVYTHSSTTKDGVNGIEANDWIIAKVGKLTNFEEIAALNGSIYVDDVAVQPLVAEKLQTVELADDVLTAVVDGVEVTLPNTSGKFYATEVVAGQTFDATIAAGLLETQNVASIRLKGPSGLRFLTKLDEAVLAAIEAEFEVVEYGTAIKPADYEGDALLVPAYRGVYFEETEDAKYIAGSIVNIKEDNMDRDFVGMGYAKIKLSNGAIVTVYSETSKTVSVADQAKATLEWAAANENDLTAADIEVLEYFAAYAN